MAEMVARAVPAVGATWVARAVSASFLLNTLMESTTAKSPEVMAARAAAAATAATAAMAARAGLVARAATANSYLTPPVMAATAETVAPEDREAKVGRAATEDPAALG
jgi:hypothetical protein